MEHECIGWIQARWDQAARGLRVLRPRLGGVEGLGLSDLAHGRLSAGCRRRGTRSSAGGRSARHPGHLPAPAHPLRPHPALLRHGRLCRLRHGVPGGGRTGQGPLQSRWQAALRLRHLRRQRPGLPAVDPAHRLALDPLRVREVRPRKALPGRGAAVLGRLRHRRRTADLLARRHPPHA